MSTKTERQPAACRCWLVWMSSVIESSWKPPIASSAARRNTAPLPTKNAPPQASRPRLDAVVEQVLLVRDAARDAERALEDVGVAEVVRCLHEADVRVPEPRDGLLEERGRRDVIGVEDRRRARPASARARGSGCRPWRACAARAGNARRSRSASSSHRVAVTVVEHVDLGARVTHRARGDERLLEDLERLPEDRDQHVDARTVVRRCGTRALARARRSPPAPRAARPTRSSRARPATSETLMKGPSGSTKLSECGAAPREIAEAHRERGGEEGEHHEAAASGSRA